MIMHRQVFDFVHFLRCHGEDAYGERQCLFIQCRLLKNKTPVLLPTPLLCFIYSMRNSADAKIVNAVYLPMHTHFAANMFPYTVKQTVEASLSSFMDWMNAQV